MSIRRVVTSKIRTFMWSLGMPLPAERATHFADIYRAALKAGLDEKQASQFIKLAYYAAEGFTWEISPGAERLERATKERNAERHPNGKDAEELRAEREGRPSRWGTPEFHRPRSVA